MSVKFYVSFGVQYARTFHPVFWKVPDLPNRLWVVEADDELSLRELLRDRMDNQYAFIYTEDTVELSWFPAGTFTYDIDTGEIELGEDVPERPKVILEWSADDSSPPCIDFTCVCGYWKHLCDGPDWVSVDGNALEAPGVVCGRCGKKWSLYEITPVNEFVITPRGGE